MEKPTKKIEKSEFCVSPNGRLCEIMEAGTCVYIHVYNSVRDDPWVGLAFGFNPRWISRWNGW